MATSLHKQFPNHPGQACASAEGKIWAIAVRRMLPADWLALVDGLTPRSLLQYSLQTVPDALVFRAAADGDPGVPQSSVLTRTAERQRIEDANTLKTVTKEAHVAELKNDFFVSLELSLSESAPLLLDQLRKDHELAYSAAMHDGPVAFTSLWDKYHDVGLIRAPEARVHDDFLYHLRLHPLPANCEPARFEARVSDALQNHIPFLQRPFKDNSHRSQWVVEQLPVDLKGDGRRLLDTLTAAQLLDPHLVAQRCFAIVQDAHVPDAKEGEFLGSLNDVAPRGRRPRGLNTGNGSAKTPKTGGGGSRPAPATACSNANTPRGKTCELSHHGPCFRDNLWEGPVPHRLWKNKEAMAKIEKDRVANASKRGETCKTLKAPEKAETLGLMCDDVSDDSSDSEADVDADVKAQLPADDLTLGAELQCEHIESSVQMGIPVQSSIRPHQLRSHKRMNLIVPHAACDAAAAAGAVFDTVNNVYYVPPRVDLYPHRAWLPWDVEDVALGADGFVSPTVLHAAGDVKSDGSPDFRRAVNRDARAVSTPPRPQSAWRASPAALPSSPDVVQRRLGAQTDAPTVAPPIVCAPVVADDPPVPRAPRRGLYELIADAYSSGDFLTFAMLIGAVALTLAYVAAYFLRFADACVAWVSSQPDFDGSVSTWINHERVVDRLNQPSVTAAAATFLTIALRFNDAYWFLARVCALLRRYALDFPARNALIFVAWCCVVKGVFGNDVRAVKCAVGPHLGNAALLSGVDLAHTASLSVSRTVVFDFQPVEDILLAGGFDASEPEHVYVVDGGAKRGCVRELSLFVEGSTRPCPFRIRSVEGKVFQPSLIGTARIPVLTEDGSVQFIVMHDTIHVPNCPHDIVSPGRLCWAGCSFVLRPGHEHSYMQLPHGARVTVFNRGILFIPKPECTVVPRAPPASGATVGRAEGHDKHLVYWCSGREHSLARAWSVAGGSSCVELDRVHGIHCDIMRDSVVDEQIDLLHTLSTRGVVSAVFSPSCGPTSVLRFRHLSTHPVLVTIDDPVGVPGLSEEQLVKVRSWLQLCFRCCAHAQRVFDAGGNFLFEAPPRRNASDGPFAPCCARSDDGGLKFPLHYTVWQTPPFLELAQRCSLSFLHLPSCFFTDRGSLVAEGPQKIYTFAYTPGLAPAFASLAAATVLDGRIACGHSSHRTSLVGPNNSGRSARYPDAICDVIARALARPHSSAWEPAHEVCATAAVEEPAGLRADRRRRAPPATAVRAQGVGASSSLTSHGVHRRYLHRSSSQLRRLPEVCSDIPPEWAQLLDIEDGACPECLRANTTRQGSRATVPVVTEAGEIVSFDIWKFHVASVYGGWIYLFGAIDNKTSFAFLVALKFKSEAPLAIAEVVRQANAIGVTIRRFHTDNENVLHSEESTKATVSDLAPEGVLVTTSCEYHSRQNSVIERFWRTLNDAARPGFSASQLGDSFYIHALIDACAKLNLLPYTDGRSGSPYTAFHGKPAAAAPYRTWGCLAYVYLEHPLRSSSENKHKSEDRCAAGVLLGYGRSGGLRDRFRPGWCVLVPSASGSRVIFSHHVTTVESVLPSLRDLEGDLRVPVDATPTSFSVVEGAVIESNEHVLGAAATPIETEPDAPATDADAHARHAAREPASPVAFTVAADDDDGAPTPRIGERVGRLARDARPESFSLSLDLPLRDHISPGGFHPLNPVSVAAQSFLADPRGVGLSDSFFLDDSPVDATDSSEVEAISLCVEDCAVADTCVRNVSSSVPERSVEFPWGTVPYPWHPGRTVPIFETGVDDSVFVMLDEFYGTSLDANDDPTWERAIKSNDSQEWWNAGYEELANLERFGVIERVPADSIGADEDIYDTMNVCKVKRGVDNTITRRKIRTVLCGNQMNRSALRVDMRTTSPTIRSASFKACCACAVLNGARHTAFDVVAAYLQGTFSGQRVIVRAPPGFRTYDERGVEEVWILHRPLYGAPDAGRIWYNTFAYYLCFEDQCKFQRSHYDPSVFVCDVDESDGGGQLVLTLYVDDGRVFDTNATVCDAFMLRLAERFAIKPDGLEFYLGMEITIHSPRSITLSSRTYIENLCLRFLDKPAGEYPAVHTPADAKLVDAYEAALSTRGEPAPRELRERYCSLVGGMLFPAPSVRIDVLLVCGILARAFTFPTELLWTYALRALIYLGQHASYGLHFSADGDRANVATAWSDSNWSVSRSISGGAMQLAGSNIWALSKRQDCTAGSSAHAEIIAASVVANEVRWFRGLLEDLRLLQTDPTPLYMDNSAVYSLSRDFTSCSKTRHIERRHFSVREAQLTGVIATTQVASADNWSDFFTKVLPRGSFELNLRRLMNLARVGISIVRPRSAVRT